MTFRDHLITASLKPVHPLFGIAAGLAFRDHLITASLKRRHQGL